MGRLSWLCWSIKLLFVRGGPMSPSEAKVQAEVARLQAKISEDSRLWQEAVDYKDRRILDLELENRKLKADVVAAQHECKLLADIHERDRKRVEADLAAYSAQIAIAERPPPQRRTS